MMLGSTEMIILKKWNNCGVHYAAGRITFVLLWTFLYTYQSVQTQHGSWSKYTFTLHYFEPHPLCVLQAKKVVVFLGRASPTHMVKELMKELEVCYGDIKGVWL